MFIPQVDELLTIELPQERVRSRICHVRDEDSIIVELISVPVSKAHTYKKDDLVSCRRKSTILGEIWEAVSPTELYRAKLLEEIKRGQIQAEEKKTAIISIPEKKVKPKIVKRPAKPKVKEKISASQARKLAGDDKPKHPRDAGKRSSAQSSCGSSSTQRKAKQPSPRGK